MAYTKVGWDETTPINPANLDQMDTGIKDNNTLLLSHSTRHQNGGADEIDVEGLSGVLAQAQPPQSHSNSHESGGSDALNLAGLSGAPTSQAGAKNIWVQSSEPTAEAVGDIWIKT